jgi:proline dehydrogenase
MSALANSASPFLNPDKNPLLRYALKKTFYAQFCAGQNAAEVRRTIASLKNRVGLTGVILGYAREVVLTEDQSSNLASCDEGPMAEQCVRDEIIPWATGTLETVRLAGAGDFVALKFTGAGRQALFNLSQRLAPSKALASAIDAICTLAASRNVRLLFDAEQQAVQAGIDDWTVSYMKKYNTPERALVYGTYQAYLKSTPATLSEHLVAAREGNFALGVKLVRGAYLGSDPRHLIHDTKAEADAAYDGLAAAILLRQWSGPLQVLQPSHGGEREAAFPTVDLVLASHNRESVSRARAVVQSAENKPEVVFAQLQGMADEISCELVAASKGGSNVAKEGACRPHVYKYLVWGSTSECMRYLLRRAEENRDAVGRTRNGRDAMRSELWRRLRSTFGVGRA